MNNLPRILLVDESPSDRRLASLVLLGEFDELNLEAVGTAVEFSGRLAAGRFGMVVTEARFSWGSGLEVTRLVREARPNCPIILFTAETGEELWSETLRLGVDGYLAKSSDGFVRLPSVVRSVFFRTRRRAMSTARDAPTAGWWSRCRSESFQPPSTARSWRPTRHSLRCWVCSTPRKPPGRAFPDCLRNRRRPRTGAPRWRPHGM